MAFLLELILFPVLGVLALVGALVFLSFGQQESKRHPKSIEDQARDETYQKKYQPYWEAGKLATSGLGKLLRTFFTPYSLLLVGTFTVAVGITFIAVNVISLRIAAWVYFPFVALALPIFPTGLSTFLKQVLPTSLGQESAMSTQIIAGWLTYLSLYLLGAMTKDRYLFVLIYLLFLTLLIMNVSGCVQDAHLYCPDGGC